MGKRRLEMENLCRSMDPKEIMRHLNGYSIFEKPPDGNVIPEYPIFIHYLKRIAHKIGLWDRHAKKVAHGSIIKTFQGTWIVETSGKKTIELRKPETNEKFTKTYRGPDGVPKFYVE